jgi:PAS domain S-box-containing protein
MKINDLDAVEDTKQTAQRIENIKSRGWDNFETKHKTKDGELRDVLVTVQSIFLNKSIVMIATFHDITDLKRQSAELALISNRLGMIFENNAAGIFVVDEDRNILLANERFCEILGYTKAQLIGQSAEILHISKESYLCFASNFENAKSGHRAKVEYKFCKKDKSEIWCEFLGTAISLDGLKDGVIWSVLDISERKNSEEALQKTDKLTKQLFKQIPGVIYQYQRFEDGTSCFPFASEHIYDIYEVKPNEAKEDATKVLSRIYPDDYEHVMQTIMQSYQTLTVWECDYRVNLPIKGIRWLRGVAKPEKQLDESVLWSGYIHDITDNKNSELELKETKECVHGNQPWQLQY